MNLIYFAATKCVTSSPYFPWFAFFAALTLVCVGAMIALFWSVWYTSSRPYAGIRILGFQHFDEISFIICFQDGCIDTREVWAKMHTQYLVVVKDGPSNCKYFHSRADHQINLHREKTKHGGDLGNLVQVGSYEQADDDLCLRVLLGFQRWYKKTSPNLNDEFPFDEFGIKI